jgi:RHS repeat-associated protein
MSYDFSKESQSCTAKTGTGGNLLDEFERDNLAYKPQDPVRVIPFAVPGISEPFSVLEIMRDENGRIVERLVAFDNFTQKLKYEYDVGGRLHKVWSEGQLIEEYLYGKYGERYFSAAKRMEQRTFRYGPGLRLEQAGNVKYFYDEHGRLVKKLEGSNVTNYSYHHSGQLAQVKLPNGRRISYFIDSEGKRMSKFINSEIVERYLWSDFITLAAVTDNYGNHKEFTYDDEGCPISMLFNDNVYYFAADQVGTIYTVANEGGNEVKRIICDSFGNKLIDTNELVDVPLGFAAGLYDKDTGLVHFGFREYDPSIGRFITPDPLGLAGGDVDVYGYCTDDPVNGVDRYGLRGDFGGAGSRGSSFGGLSGGIGGLTGLGRGVLSGPSFGGSGDSGGAINGLLGKGKGVLSDGFGGDGHRQNAKNNAVFEKQSQQSLNHLNQSSVQAAREMEKAAKELAGKQTQFNAQEQARKDRTARAGSELRERQRRAATLANGKEETEKGFFEAAGEYVSGKIDGALDFAHKNYSPLTHPDTQKQSFDFINGKINGRHPAYEPVIDAAKQGWQNMVEKEKRNQQRKNNAAKNLKPSTVTDIFSSNHDVKKNRADTIKAGVQDGLKDYADVQLSTPDAVVTPITSILSGFDKVLKGDKRR